MTTKADVLAAREQYERVAEAYLRERGWITNEHVLWQLPSCDWPHLEWSLEKAVFAATHCDREPMV